LCIEHKDNRNNPLHDLNCPCCQLHALSKSRGLKQYAPTPQSVLNVFLPAENGDGWTEALWYISRPTLDQILVAENEVLLSGDKLGLNRMKLAVTRHGSSLQTTYTVFPSGHVPQNQVPDVQIDPFEAQGASTREGILKSLIYNQDRLNIAGDLKAILRPDDPPIDLYTNRDKYKQEAEQQSKAAATTKKPAQPASAKPPMNPFAAREDTESWDEINK
jgi:hypothetical protein